MFDEKKRRRAELLHRIGKIVWLAILLIIPIAVTLVIVIDVSDFAVSLTTRH